MDHPQITHVSLCAGYGGIDLGLHRCIPNLRTIAYAEIEAFACELLLARMESGSLDAAPIWPDLKSFPWGKLRDRVDILSGGYPCQPFSAAGRRLGKEDPRHLWPYIADGISILRPRLCFFENVEGHISLGLREVIEHLGRLGYSATWGIFSAAECGAPHQRKRVFILAHSKCAGLEGFRRYAGQSSFSEPRHSGASLWPSRPGQPQFGWEPPRVVGNAKGQRPSTRWTQYEGLSGQLCSSGTGGAMGNARSEESSRLSSRAGRDEVAEAGQPGQGLGNAQCPRLDGCAGARLSGPGRPSGVAAWTDQENRERGQTQPSLGRNSDGPPGWMDYAELCISGDSRVDELRLLGNGVVPAVAERAFVTLLDELLSDA